MTAMTITLQLSPEAEALLRAKASREASDPSTVVTEIVVEALEREATDVSEGVAGVQRGLDDFERGRFRSFEDFSAEQRQKHGLPADV